MALIYREDWTPGNSLFTSVSPYNRPSDGTDPLYPFMRGAELVKIVDGMLDKDPDATGEFETYQQAGIWIKGAGSITVGDAHAGSNFWNADQGCIECLYHPTVDSLAQAGEGSAQAPLISVCLPDGGVVMGVSAAIDEAFLAVHHQNEGEHDSNVEVLGAAMPVAGQPYKVRIGWQCGTMDLDTLIAAPDGFMRIWINDVLMYEATDLSLALDYFTDPVNHIDSVQFGYFGLLGPLEYFAINDSGCVTATPLVFTSGKTSTPLVWAKLLLKGAP